MMPAIPRGIFLAIVLTLALATPTARATTFSEQLDASPRHQEWVDVPYAEGKTVRAYVVHPERKDAGDSIVIIHDIRGMSDWIRVVTDRLAAAGFVAIVPDLLTGKGPDGGNTESFKDGSAVGEAIRALDADEITQRLQGCVKYVRDLPSTTDTVSVGGFCWGGSETFRYATNDNTLKAAFVYYGSAPEDTATLKSISCPVYGFYGENDNRINAGLDATTKAMSEAGKKYEPVIYAGMGHGFLKSGMEAEADETAKQRVSEAWERWIKLLKE
ncbi:MAG: dienelactone hydrolase family protein [Candidatus Hydrogenedentes bacterium]|nr:dienelactone hydrolase family protein [Candidatus Hydrogenedentota bacterium]